MRPLRLVGAVASVVLVVCTIAYVALLARTPPPVDDLDMPVAAGAVPSDAAGTATSAPKARARASTPPTVAAAWVTKTAAKAGIPAPAVRAYANAQLSEPKGCDVGWTTLAGIGWVESQHGTIGGRTLGDDGHSSTPVLGPALNGKGFAAIRATPETTAWHGDPTWDHAVGPLQFIPSTWETWGADGDGDGVADPNDIDDAAFTAARYLCADGHDLKTGAGWADAVFGYNHDQSYVDSVYAAATAYADRTS